MSINGEEDFKSFITTVGIYIGILVVIVIGMILIINQNTKDNVEVDESELEEIPEWQWGDSKNSKNVDQDLILVFYIYSNEPNCDINHNYKLVIDSILYDATIKNIEK